MKLHTRLLLIIAPCGVASVLSIYLAVYTGMYSQAKENVSAQSVRELALIGDAIWKADTISRKILETTATGDPIRDFMTDGYSVRVDKQYLTDILKNFVALQPGARSLRLVDVTGEDLLHVTNGQLSVDPATEIMPNLGTTASPIHRFQPDLADVKSATPGTLMYHFPIFTLFQNSPGMELGWVVYEVDLSDIISVEVLSLDSTGDLFLQGAEGQMLSLTGSPASPELRAFIKDGGENSASEIDVWESKIRLFDTGSLISRYALPGGINMYSYTAESAIQSTLANLSFTLAAASAIFTFMGIATFLVLVRFLVLRPLVYVRQTAMAIGLPEYDSFKKIQNVLARNDEIGDLSRAIDSTSNRLEATIKQLKTSHSEIERIAYTDYLTDLPNRRMFQNLAQAAVAEAKESGHTLSALFMNLDNFKNVNDLLGHRAGDELLKQVSNRLVHELAYNQHGADQTRIVARQGGDEFIFLVNSGHAQNSDEVATRIATEIMDTVSRTIVLKNTEHTITSSIGIAHYPAHSNHVDGLITCADTALCEAKRTHKKGSVIFTDQMLDTLTEKLQMESDLREALARKQFHLHYQPKFDIRQQVMMGAEALIRWQHPTKGNIPPDRFICVAEECGLIDDIGEWVIYEACRQWREWSDAGIPIGQIAVNVSTRQFERGDLLAIIRDAMKKYNCPSAALEIELTESCVMEAYDSICSTLSQLRQDGISVAIDDFGTGYSSLSLISSMPIDTLKIDRSFVSGMKENENNAKIVSTVLNLAEQLSFKVVAEGIEHADELSFLDNLNCDYGQGYYLSRPLSAESMAEVLKEHTDKTDKAA